MPYKVEHVREDAFLEAYTKEPDPSLEQTYIGKVTLPYHRLLLNFISTELNDEYQSMKEVQKALQKWGEFVEKQQGEPPQYKWHELNIVNGNLIACGWGPGGDFIVAKITSTE